MSNEDTNNIKCCFPLPSLQPERTVDGSRTATVLNNEWDACPRNPKSHFLLFYSETAYPSNSQAFSEPPQAVQKDVPTPTSYSVSWAQVTQVTQAIECTVVPIWVTSPGFIFEGIGALVPLTRLNQDVAQMGHQQGIGTVTEKDQPWPY